jgi:hypothetical protein
MYFSGFSSSELVIWMEHERVCSHCEAEGGIYQSDTGLSYSVCHLLNFGAMLPPCGQLMIDCSCKTRQNFGVGGPRKRRVHSMTAGLMVALAVLTHSLFYFSALLKDKFVCDHVCCECDDGDAEAGEHGGDHAASCKDGMLAPGIVFRPRVAVDEWAVRHNGSG